MIRTEKHISTFAGGQDRDTSVNKYQNVHFFDMENMEIISEDSLTSAAASNVKGNVLKLIFDEDDTIIGYCKIRNNFNDDGKDSIVFFTVNTNAPEGRIYLAEVDPQRISGTINMDVPFAIVGAGATAYKAGYIYRSSDLNFDVDYPIKAEGVYESVNLRKVYWVDGLNHYRYMILDRVIDGEDVSVFDINPMATLNAPVSEVTSGGAYKAGMVQHAYQLYIRNGARTTYSPVSNLVHLTANDGAGSSATFVGSNLGDNTGKAVRITFTGLDTNYDRIRIIAIHYTEANISPTINIVGEIEYISEDISFIDNGYTVLGTIPIEEFRLLGQVDYVAEAIASKNNILFLANITEDVWNPNFLDPDHVDYWDGRAVRYRNYTLPGGTGTDSTSIPVDYTHELDSTFVRVDDNTIEVTIPNFSTTISLPVGRVLEDVISVFSNVGFDPILLVVEGTYNNGNYSSEGLNTSIGSVFYNDGTDVLSFNVSNQGDDYFTGFTHLTTGNIYELLFSYEYSSIVPVDISAKVTDLSSSSVTIEVPVADTIIEWNNAGWTGYVYNHDGINNFNDFDNDNNELFEYKFQSDGTTLGAEGPNVEIEFVTEDIRIANSGSSLNIGILPPYTNSVIDTWKKSSMREEVYRINVVFFNKKMQRSAPQWICDLRMPSNSDITTVVDGAIVYGRYVFPKVTIKNFPNDPDILGWQIFRCERKREDRGILARGAISTLFKDTTDSDSARSYGTSTANLIRAEDSGVSQYKHLVELISPDVSFDKNIQLVSGDRIRIEGRYSSIWPDFDNISPNRRYVREIPSSAPARSTTDSVSKLVVAADIIPVAFYGSIPEYNYGGVSYKPLIKFSSGGSNYYGQKGTNLVVQLEGDLTITAANTGYVLGSYARDVFNVQYGGNTYEARTYNQLIPYSQFTLDTTSNTTCYFGDTTISYFAYLKASIPTVSVGSNLKVEQVVIIPVESYINCAYRLDPLSKYIDAFDEWNLQEYESDGVEAYGTYYPLDLGNLYRYNTVYSISGNALLIQSELFDTVNIEHNDVKIIATDKKVNNEYFDSWTNISTNNSIELESKYGPIRNIWNFQDKLFAGQDSGISLVAVNDRSLIADMNRSKLTLGTGEVLERYDYLTTTSGIQDYFDVTLGDKSFYYLDRNNKTFYTFTGEGDVPLSEIKGIRSLLRSYGNISTVRSGYDSDLKRVFFYVSDGTLSKNIVYDEYQQCYIGTQSFVPDLMLNLNKKFYSIKAYNGYIHNAGNRGTFYGTVNNSTITLIINPNGEIVNKYDCLDMRVDVFDAPTVHSTTEMFTSMVASNNYQTFTKTLTLDSTVQKIGRIWRTWLLPSETGSDFFRMTDTYVMVKLLRSNANNKKLVLHDVISYYRPTKN